MKKFSYWTHGDGHYYRVRKRPASFQYQRCNRATYRHRQRPIQPLKMPYSGPFKSGPEHPRWVNRDALLIELKSRIYGSWVVIGTEIVTVGRSRKVLCRCYKTGQEHLVNVDNLLAGKTKGPRGVKHQISKNSKVLGERYDAMMQRCKNPRDRNYPNYGGRGIEVRFESRPEFILWMEENLPHENYRGVEIDRTDNNGHYEPGNLRLVTPRENLCNTRRNRHVIYRGQSVLQTHFWHVVKHDIPNFSYSREWTTKLLAMDLSPDEVIRRSRNWQTKVIEFPSPEIVRIYRE